MRISSLVSLAIAFILGTALVVSAADSQNKAGTIKSVDAAAKTFTLDFGANTQTFTCNDQTAVRLADKESTFEEAIKVGVKASVTYTKAGDARVASKVAVVGKKEEKKEERR